MENETTSIKFEPTPAIVALMGHQKVAGIVSEASFPAGFLRVDVPAVAGMQAYTRYINPKSLYDMHPVSHKTMLAKAEELKVQPIDVWDIKQAAQTMVEGLIQQGKLLEAPKPEITEDYFDENDPYGVYRDSGTLT